MQIKCEYCGSMIEETADKCPFCGATNTAVKRTADKTPKTIAELQQWYQDRHLPPYETTRFFIGINYKKPKAFGIYQDGDQFIVYKNKANGERAIRYQGTDEAYAVNELYLKLKSEILNQKANNQTRKQQQTLTREQKKEKHKICGADLHCHYRYACQRIRSFPVLVRFSCNRTDNRKFNSGW